MRVGRHCFVGSSGTATGSPLPLMTSSPHTLGMLLISVAQPVR
jgi:hypothetical protein